jgi:hypothetical protein
MNEPLKPILLKHQDHTRVFILDRSTGGYEKGLNLDLKLRNVNGLGFEYKCGLWKRDRVFCALFVSERTIVLRIGAVEVDLCDPSTSLTRTQVVPLAYDVEVHHQHQLLARCRYWRQILLQDPDDDLLAFACQITRDTTTLEETRRRWVEHFPSTAES